MQTIRAEGAIGSLRELFSNFLKLLTDYRSIEAITGRVKPIAFSPSTKNRARIKLLIGLIVSHGRL